METFRLDTRLPSDRDLMNFGDKGFDTIGQYMSPSTLGSFKKSVV